MLFPKDNAVLTRQVIRTPPNPERSLEQSRKEQCPLPKEYLSSASPQPRMEVDHTAPPSSEQKARHLAPSTPTDQSDISPRLSTLGAWRGQGSHKQGGRYLQDHLIPIPWKGSAAPWGWNKSEKHMTPRCGQPGGFSASETQGSEPWHLHWEEKALLHTTLNCNRSSELTCPQPLPTPSRPS